MRKHRLAERLLVDVLGLEWEYVHDEACRWEHVISERVERKILALIGEHRESPYGNPIPGLDELGEPLNEDFRRGVTSLVQLAAEVPRIVTVRRIGEPAQVEPEALNLLTDAGLMPGRRVRVRREGARIVVVREGAEEATGVSLPEDVAIHVFADTPA
jgi:DtxR family Mn-dependent transcriptional regulator